MDGSWHDPTTWSGGTVPDASADVMINHLVSVRAGLFGQANSVSISGLLILESGAVLQLSGGSRVLLVTGILECADGRSLMVRLPRMHS